LFTDTGLRSLSTLNASNPQTLLTFDNAKKVTTNTFSGTLGGSGSTEGLAVHDGNPGGNSAVEGFFNSLQVTSPRTKA